jgi:hypothetical protein
MRYIAAFISMLLLAGMLPVAPALGQNASGEKAAESTSLKLPEPLTHDAVRDLVSTISDADARKLLVQVLDGLAAKAPKSAGNVEPSGVAAAVQEGVSGISDSVSEMVVRVPRVATGLAESLRNFMQAHGGWSILAALGVMVVALAAAMGAERLVNAYAATWRNRIDGTREPSSLIEMFA